MTTAARSFGRSSSILAVLGNPDFRLLWLAGGADNSGRWMEAVVMALLMLDIGGSALQVGAALRLPLDADAAVRAGVWDGGRPRQPAAGHDRGQDGHRRGDGGVAGAWSSATRPVPEHLFIGSLLLGWLYVLEFPSRRSFIYELVGSRELVGAMSLETITTTIGRLLGPLAAGIVVGQGGVYCRVRHPAGAVQLGIRIRAAGQDAAACQRGRTVRHLADGQDGVWLRLQQSGGAGRADGHRHIQRPGLQRGVAVSGGGYRASGGRAGADRRADLGPVLRHAWARRWQSAWCPTCATTGGYSASVWRFSSLASSASPCRRGIRCRSCCC